VNDPGRELATEIPAPTVRDRLERGHPSIQYRLRSDADLIGLARGGNHAAFDEFVTRHRDRIYTLAFKALGSVELAAEAMCEAFVAVHRNLDRLSSACTPRSWLYLHAIRAICSRMENGIRRLA
jgi:RNA polymerase sigma-70 factor (ECF subfamily)